MGHLWLIYTHQPLIPLYPFLTAKLGIKLSTISLILACGHLFSSMMQPLFGFLQIECATEPLWYGGLVMGAVFIPLTALQKMFGLWQYVF